MPKKFNKYIENDDCYLIELYKSYSEEVIDYALISKDDYQKAIKIFWQKTKYGYARGYDNVAKRSVLLHVYLLNSDTKTTILDHINRNKLDCRRLNLRVADKQLNSFNRDTPQNATTRHKGVSFDKRRNKYRAYIKILQRQIWLGYYENLADAVTARKLYEKKLEDIEVK